MSSRLMVRALGALSLLAMLSGCGIPDLAAHGIKEWEKRGQNDQASSPPAAQSQPSTRAEEPPPPPTAPAPRRSSVTVQELPPQ